MKRSIKLLCALLPSVILFGLMLPLTASADFPLRLTKNLPSSYSIRANQLLTLSVEASGGNGSYTFQWYSSCGPLDWTGNSIRFTVTTEDTVWCIVSSGDQSVVSNTCTLNVVSDPAPSAAPGVLAPVTAPRITGQPRSIAVPLGYPGGTLSVAATNEWLHAGVELKYQWYSCPINNMRYASPIEGATSASYNVPVSYQEGTVYYVVEICSYNGKQTSAPVYSDVVRVKYGAASILEVTKSPTSERVDEGGKATFIAHADGATSHQWRFLPKGYPGERFLTAANLGAAFPGVNVIGADSDILVLANIPAAMNGMKIFCVYYENPGSFVITDSATLSVNAKPATQLPPNTPHPGSARIDRGPGRIREADDAVPAAPIISVQPEGAALTYGENVTLSVGVTGTRPRGTEIRYQWYKSDRNSNAYGTAIAGAQSAEYTPEAISGSKYYYVGVWASDGIRNSKVVYSDPAVVSYTAPRPTPMPPRPSEDSEEGDLLSRLALPVVALFVSRLLEMARS